MLLRSAFGAFHFPAFQASTSLLVPTEQLARVNGLNQSLQGLMNIVAPPLGALLLSLMSLQAVLAVDIATAGLAILPLLFIAIPQPAVRAVAEGGSLVKNMLVDTREGFRYVKAWPGLLALIIVAMALNFIIVPTGALMPLLVTQHFQGGPAELAWLESAMGIGVIVGGIALGVWGGFKRRVITALSGILLMSGGILLLGLTPAGLFALAVVSMFVMGFGSPMANGPIFAVLQSTVRPEMQGRVMSLVNSGAAAMMPLSLLLAGPLADLVGIRTFYVVGGIACGLVALGCAFVRPLMNIESNGHAAAAAAVAAVEPAP
jgi:DHA3 family macrolide efflux protein-like MFS transporter